MEIGMCSGGKPYNHNKNQCGRNLLPILRTSLCTYLHGDKAIDQVYASNCQVGSEDPHEGSHQLPENNPPHHSSQGFQYK